MPSTPDRITDHDGNRIADRNLYPGVEGSIGPSPMQRYLYHVYARDVHSGAGNCVCGADLGSWVHLQAAPGVPVPKRKRYGTAKPYNYPPGYEDA